MAVVTFLNLYISQTKTTAIDTKVNFWSILWPSNLRILLTAKLLSRLHCSCCFLISKLIDFLSLLFSSFFSFNSFLLFRKKFYKTHDRYYPQGSSCPQVSSTTGNQLGMMTPERDTPETPTPQPHQVSLFRLLFFKIVISNYTWLLHSETGGWMNF